MEVVEVPLGHCPDPANIVGGSNSLPSVAVLKKRLVTPTFPWSGSEKAVKSYLTNVENESKKKVNTVLGSSSSMNDHFSQVPYSAVSSTPAYAAFTSRRKVALGGGSQEVEYVLHFVLFTRLSISK